MLVASFVLGSLFAVAAADEATTPVFTRQPAAKSVGGKVRIAFAVDRKTDVAVFIENAKGEIVRHLVAGVLGQNPPAPLTRGLSQSIEWDGKADYSRPAGPGPFTVRVAIGMNVKYDKVAVRDENALNHIKGLAVGPDGTVYVLDAPGGAWKGEQIIAFGRDGKYRRGVMPFPVNLKMEQVKALGAFELRGRPTPMVEHSYLQLFTGVRCPRKTGMAVTPDGKAVLRLTGGRKGAALHIAAVAPDGSAPWERPSTAPLLVQTHGGKESADNWTGQPAIAVSPDGRWAYVAGLVNRKKKPYTAVFRVSLPARALAVRFFGDAGKAGKDKALLGGTPQGLACDGQGNLLISDTANDRVVVAKEANGSYVAEFAAAAPGPLAVDPKTGAVYVTSGRRTVSVAKYSGWKDAEKVAEISFRVRGNGTYVMGLDANAPKPIVWIGTDGGKLVRMEDLGAKFGDAVQVSSTSGASGHFLDMSVDRFRPDREIYWRGNDAFWYRYHENTDKLTKVLTAQNGQVGNGGGGGSQIMSGPDGNIYVLSYPYHMRKLDRDAKPIGFTEGGYPDMALAKYGRMEKPKPKKGGMWVPVNMTEIKHTLGIRADGNVFVFHPLGSGGRPPKALHMYSPTGRQLTSDPIIWKVSDGCVGPRFDAAGNIYVAEIVNPGKRAYPEEFEKIFGEIKMGKTRPSGVQDVIANMYGSIVKFSPRGGMIHYRGKDWPNPFKGQPKLDGLSTIDAAFYARSRQQPVKITGAEWLSFGYSHVEVASCICETTRFDVDEFGRVFYPDLCLYQVRVVDTNGNPILEFGGYGNTESMGPDSPVVDPKTGKVRPRRKGDSEGLKSPFAEPEIAFAWLVGVLATDKYVYTGDSINRRMLRCRIMYAAEATCAVR